MWDRTFRVLGAFVSRLCEAEKGTRTLRCSWRFSEVDVSVCPSAVDFCVLCVFWKRVGFCFVFSVIDRGFFQGLRIFFLLVGTGDDGLCESSRSFAKKLALEVCVVVGNFGSQE